MPIISGVKAINRQKFLTELGKLLTFMYEEDRQLALSYYERMFDAAEDEQALIQGLMSPTRQAVVIARAYDAKERKLSVSSSSKNEDGYQDDKNEIPRFVLAINRTFDELFPDNTPLQETVENQISLFDEETQEPEEEPEEEEPEEPEEEPAEEETEEPGEPEEEPLPEEEPEDDVPAEEDPAEEEPAEQKPQADLEDTQEFHLNLNEEQEDAEEEPSEEEPEEPEEEPAPEKTEEDLYWESLYPEHRNPETGEVEDAPADAAAKEETAQDADPAEEEAVPETEQEEKLEWTRKPEPEEKPAEEPKTASTEPQPAKAAIQEIGKTARKSVQDEEQKKFDEAFGKRGKKNRKAKKQTGETAQPEVEGPVKTVAKVPLLVLYLIAAIPITLVLTAMLLVPTVASLAGALGMIALGTLQIVAAFSSFAVMADIMLLLGSAIVALALGLLLLWVFFWFLGGVIGGLIRAVMSLGRKWCYKEVPAE